VSYSIKWCDESLTSLVFSAIFIDGESLPWAAAGQNVTMYLTAVDPIHLNVGTVLCPLSDVIPLATVFTARIIVFEIGVPITAGTSVSQ
jgi:elongation factor 1 alpha-like protein